MLSIIGSTALAFVQFWHKYIVYSPKSKGSRLCVFTSGSFAYDHFQLNDINSDFLFALGAKKRKIHQNGIRIHFGSRFAVAYGATNPQRIISFFIHVYTSDDGIALRSTSGILHYLYSKMRRSYRSTFTRHRNNNKRWPVACITCSMYLRLNYRALSKLFRIKEGQLFDSMVNRQSTALCLIIR